MASPLSIFRKYEYVLLVVFGCMLMIAFVVAPPILEYQRSAYRGSLAENATVVSWKGGSLTQRELDSVVLSRNLVRSFLNVLMQRTMELNGSPRVPPVLTVVTEESVVRTMLLADEARRLGLQVSDQAIMRYLEQLTGELIPLGQIGAIFRESLGDRMTEEQMFDVLRQELLAQNYMVMLHPDLFLSRGSSTPPLADWEYFQRLHRRVKLELVALKAEQFKSVLDERGIAPTEEQIRALYEAGKDRYHDPQSPEPGFKRRPRIAFQYVRGDLNAFTEKEMEQALAGVSDEDVEKFYEENKERYRILDLPSEEDASGESAGEEAEDEEDEGAKPAMTEPAAEAEQPSPDESSPASEKPDEGEKPGEPSRTEGESSGGNEEPEPENPQSRWTGHDAVFVAMMQNEEDSPEASPQPAEEPEPTASQPPEPSVSAEGASDESAGESSSESKPQQPGSGGTAASDAGAPEKDVEAAQGEAAASDEQQPAPRYKPLDDALRKEIRDEIAREKAREIALEKLQKALSEVRREVDRYGRKLRRERESDVPPLDIESFAAERSLQTGEMPLVDILEVREYELGRSFEITAMSWPPQRQEFVELAYREGEPLYSPSQIQGEVRDIYFLYWKTREKEAYVPELDEIRDEVIDAWKTMEAFKLATEKAQEIVAEAQKADSEGQTFKDILGEDSPYEITETDEFSWLTTGFTPMGMSAPRLSEVEGVDSPGEEFMEAVFSLKVGEIGWAPNRPKTRAYVFRVLSETPGEEILRMIFLQMGNSQEIQQIAAMDREKHLRKWYEEFDAAHDLKWHRPPRA